MLHAMLGEHDSVDLKCSRAGCDAAATVALNWRNPKIHDASRTKTWLACDVHKEYLTEFLRARSFPVAVESMADGD